MRATFFGLEIARSALHISQKQLDVTGHNIANVDTPGYSRQRIETASIDPMSGAQFLKNMEHGRVGGGVEAITTAQIRDIFLDWQYRTQASTTGQWDSRYSAMYRIESRFDETGETKFGDVSAAFFDAISKVGNDYTESQSVRATVLAKANALTNYFAGKFDALESDMYYEDKVIVTKTERINAIAESLTVLNEEIYEYEFATDERANDLRDKRNLLVDELSAYMDIDYGEEVVGTDPSNIHFWITVGGDPSHRLVDHINSVGINIDKGAMNHYVATEIDSLSAQIARCNGAIGAGTGDDEAIMNQRAELVEQLAYYVQELDPNAGITIIYDNTTYNTSTHDVQDIVDALTADPPTGDLVISINGTAEPIVNADEFTKLEDVDDAGIDTLAGAFDMTRLTWDDNGNGLSDDPDEVSIRDGELYGHTVMRDGGDSANNGLPYYLFRLNEYVRKLTSAVNGIHERGWTMPYELNGQSYPSQTGISFFTAEGGGPVTAKSVMVNEVIGNALTGSVYNIAVSSEEIDADHLVPGNNLIGQEIYRLLDKSSNEDGVLFEGLWAKFTTELGVDVDHALNNITVNERVSDSLQNQRLSVMGVSIEEEMTNLIRFNHAYSAASRLVTVLDETLDKLINGTGRVGL